MKIVLTCNDCGAELRYTPKLVNTYLYVTITPCSHCVARKALLAIDQEWAKSKLEKEARV